MRSQSGLSFVEILICLGISAGVMTGIGSYLRSSSRKSTVLAARDSAMQEMDNLAKRIQKDFQRHLKASNGVELDNTNMAFNSATSPKCSDLRIRQTILGVGSAPNTVQKIEYRTGCTGSDIPDNVTRSAMHSELAESCRKAPRVTRTVWEDEATSGTGENLVFPSEAQKAMTVCFRADVLPDFTRISAEISVTYGASDTEWKTLRRSVDLVKNELGTDIEILTPR